MLWLSGWMNWSSPQRVTVRSANSYWFCLCSHKGRLSGISLGHEGRNLRSTLPEQQVRHCLCSHDPRLRSILGKTERVKGALALWSEVHAAAPVASSHSDCHLPVTTLFVVHSARLIHTKKQHPAVCELSTYCTWCPPSAYHVESFQKQFSWGCTWYRNYESCNISLGGNG